MKKCSENNAAKHGSGQMLLLFARVDVALSYKIALVGHLHYIQYLIKQGSNSTRAQSRVHKNKEAPAREIYLASNHRREHQHTRSMQYMHKKQCGESLCRVKQILDWLLFFFSSPNGTKDCAGMCSAMPDPSSRQSRQQLLFLF